MDKVKTKYISTTSNTGYSKNTNCAGAVIFDKDKKHVVCVKTNASIKFDGIWGFPKDKREKKETDFQCSTREIKEETSLKYDIDYHIPDQTKFYYEKTKKRYKINKIFCWIFNQR